MSHSDLTMAEGHHNISSNNAHHVSLDGSSKLITATIISLIMMTSSNGNIFRVTGSLWGKFPGEFPSQRPVTRSFDVSFICAWTNGWVNNRYAGDLRCHCARYDVIVMWNYKHLCELVTRVIGFIQTLRSTYVTKAASLTSFKPTLRTSIISMAPFPLAVPPNPRTFPVTMLLTLMIWWSNPDLLLWYPAIIIT